MFTIFRTAFIMLVMLTIVTGVIYPLAVTVVAQMAFPHAANGSLIRRSPDGASASAATGQPENRQSTLHTLAPVGSELIGQSFTDPKYFWGRPSSTAPMPCNGLGGSGSNVAPTNPVLVEAVKDRVARLRRADPDNQAPVPIDLVTASGSGLDPHISEAAAQYQVNRVSHVRNLKPDQVRQLVLAHTQRPTVGILGQSRVHVLRLNLALDALTASSSANPDANASFRDGDNASQEK